jgi:glycosyltransferase involved in cell wall biosynthesis
MNKSVSVIVPTYNEAGSIPTFFPELYKFCREQGWYLIIVDDCSTDGTSELLKVYNDKPEVRVLRHKVNRGYGAAVKSGIKAAATDYCITIDADGQHYIEDMDKVYKRMVSTDADMVVGSRKGLKSENRFRGAAKGIIRTFARLMMPLHIYDINSGMRMFSTAIGKEVLHLCPDGMSFCDTFTMTFINYRHLVLEEQISIRERTTGESKARIRTALETVIEIINLIVLFNPLRIFLPVSALLFGLGLGWGIYMFTLDKGITSGASFLMVTGILLFLLGLVSEQISQMRKNRK